MVTPGLASHQRNQIIPGVGWKDGCAIPGLGRYMVFSHANSTYCNIGANDYICTIVEKQLFTLSVYPLIKINMLTYRWVIKCQIIPSLGTKWPVCGYELARLRKVKPAITSKLHLRL